VPYLGIGPSAHSFDGSKRRWNVANNARYVQGVVESATVLGRGVAHARATHQRAALLTGLRTSKGVELARLWNWM
jgi:oxygen-independent coproporphyrinogen-3 oxidase